MTITLAEVRARAGRLYRQARARFITSFAILVALVILPTPLAAQRPGLTPRAIWAVVMLLLFYTNYRSYKAGRLACAESGGLASIEFYRRELERRTHALTAVLAVAGAAAWGVLLAYESGRPLVSWVPFFAILAVWGVAYYFIRREEVRVIRADLEALKGLIAKNKEL